MDRAMVTQLDRVLTSLTSVCLPRFQGGAETAQPEMRVNLGGQLRISVPEETLQVDETDLPLVYWDAAVWARTWMSILRP